MGARGLAWLLVSGLAGCPSPEDGFRLSGRVVDQNGVEVSGHEVRVLRDASPDGERCTPLRPFATLVTGENGRFETTVYRQQQTLGGPVPRFFRVEASSVSEPEWVTAFTFRFPAVDVPLPDLLIMTGPFVEPTSLTEVFLESTLDGAVAWRGPTSNQPADDRAMPTMRVARLTREDVIDANLLGIDSRLVSLELRFERPAPSVRAGNASVLRGKPCDVVAEGQVCPLTDGRMLPVRLPPGTKSVAITSPDVLVVELISVRGLQVDGDVARIFVDAADSLEPPAWRLYATVPRASELVSNARTHCKEPGLFFSSAPGIAVTRGLRVRAEDASGAALDLLSLSEVTAQ
jgi:hypothetical protein